MARQLDRASPGTLSVWADKYGICLTVYRRVTQDSDDLVGLAPIDIAAALNPYIVDCPFRGMIEEDGSSPRWDEIKRRVSEVEKATRKPGATDLNDDPLIRQFHLTGAEYAMASLQGEVSPEGALNNAILKERTAEATIRFVDMLIQQRDAPDRRRSREWAVQNLEAMRALRIAAAAHAADPQVIEALDRLKTVKTEAEKSLKALKAKVREIENKTPGGGYVNIPVRGEVPEAPFPQEAAVVVQPNPKINNAVGADIRAAAVGEAAAARDQLARRRIIADQGAVPVLAADAAAAAAARREEQERRNKALYDAAQKKNAANPGAGGPGGPGGGRRRGKKKTAGRRRKAGTRRMR